MPRLPVGHHLCPVCKLVNIEPNIVQSRSGTWFYCKRCNVRIRLGED